MRTAITVSSELLASPGSSERPFCDVVSVRSKS